MPLVSLMSGWIALYVAVLAAVHAILPGRRARNALLVVGSVGFYGLLAPRGLPVLLGSALWSYGSGLAVERWSSRRGAVLTVSLTGSAAVWLGFKYLGFLVDPVAGALGVDPAVLRIAMPAGLSFFVLSHASYPIDVYWGTERPRRDLVDWLAFALFFPVLLAGPIERVGRLMPQIEKDRSVDFAAVRSGLVLIAWGAVQKVLIADTLRVYVDAVYAIDRPAPIVAWAGAYGFMVELLADFAGLSNLARGMARLFGVEVTRNFLFPYQARTVTAFWTQWHVSLSEWLRGYIFFPVYRSPLARRWLPLPSRLVDPRHHDVIRATIATMLVSGLWHGTGWNFVLWGLVWAAAQIVERLTPAGWATPLAQAKDRVQLGLMWGFLLVTHQIFRESSLARLAHDFSALPWSGSADDRVVATVVVAFALCGTLILTAARLVEVHVAPRLAGSELALAAETTGACLAAGLVYVFGSMGSADFVYFQF